MIHRTKLYQYLFIGACAVALALPGCTKKPGEEDLSKLEEARSAAESAERKLSELRKERINLENELQQKEAEISEHEQERDELRQKMENQ